MALNILIILLIQTCIYEVFSSSYQVPVNQYYQVPRFEPPVAAPNLYNFPSVGLPGKAPPPFTSSPFPPNESPYPSPSAPRYPSSGPTTQPRPIPGVPTLTSDPCPCSSKPPSTNIGGIDPAVINNLAIALQLLIVHHILNSPVTEPCSNDEKPKYLKPNLPSLEQQYTGPPLQVYTPVAQLPRLPQQQTTFYHLPPTQTISIANPANPSFFTYESAAPTSLYPLSMMPNANPSNPPLFTYESVAPASSYHPSVMPNANPSNPSLFTYDSVSPTSSYPPPVLPNANFVGSSFGGSGSVLSSFTSPYGRSAAPLPRTGRSLMSPYEAIESNPEFSDNYSYGLNNDFQSPYQAIMAADKQKDLFSMDFY